MRVLVCALAVVFMAACSSDEAFVEACTPLAGQTPICTFKNPEDIEPLPDGKTLLVSQMGSDMERGEPGSLVFFEPATGALKTAYPAAPPQASGQDERWGAIDCPGHPGALLSPHGISLRQDAEQRWRLAVVNHGGRESVELFELMSVNEGWQLAWRGCVVPPPGSHLNDVALRRDGGLLVSHMFDKDSPKLGMFSLASIQALLGMATGHVLEWDRTQGFRVLAGSRGAFLNGVALSPDDKHVFANVYLGGEIRKIDRASGEILARAPIAKADNLAWDRQGRLLVLAHSGSLSKDIACLGNVGRTCAAQYTLWRIDPASMATETLLTHEGAPMGAATVAVEMDAALYLGSYSGNRIVRIPYRN